MTIRFIKLLVSVIWQNRQDETDCMLAILNVFATHGNVYAKTLLDYQDWDTRYENKSFQFWSNKIVMTWRKDIQ